MGLSNQEPQVLIRGGTLKKVVIYTDIVAPSVGIRTQHDIRMTEVQLLEIGGKVGNLQLKQSTWLENLQFFIVVCVCVCVCVCYTAQVEVF